MTGKTKLNLLTSRSLGREPGGPVPVAPARIFKPTNKSHELREEKWVHLDRIAGGDRRHRDFGGAATARTVQVEKPHPDHRLLEQPPPTFHLLASLYRRLQRSAGAER